MAVHKNNMSQRDQEIMKKVDKSGEKNFQNKPKKGHLKLLGHEAYRKKKKK